MTTFTVSDMTCGHCASTINKAVHDVDAAAKVEIKLDQKQVVIDSALDAEGLPAPSRTQGIPRSPSDHGAGLAGG